MAAPTSKLTALEAYISHQAYIDGQLAQLASLVEAQHDKHAPEDIHWGHVGDLGRVEELLNEAIAFLQG